MKALQPFPRAPYRSSEPTRLAITGAVRARPGLTKSELCRATGLGWGTVSHHVRRLEAAGELRRHRWRGRAVFYPPSVSSQHMFQMRLLRAPAHQQIVERLRAQPLSARELSAGLGLSRTTIRKHLREMQDHGLVTPLEDHRFGLVPGRASPPGLAAGDGLDPPPPAG